MLSSFSYLLHDILATSQLLILSFFISSNVIQPPAFLFYVSLIAINGSRYSRMDQVKFVDDSL